MNNMNYIMPCWDNMLLDRAGHYLNTIVFKCICVFINTLTFMYINTVFNYFFVLLNTIYNIYLYTKLIVDVWFDKDRKWPLSVIS